jgi:hypothetical protein
LPDRVRPPVRRRRSPLCRQGWFREERDIRRTLVKDSRGLCAIRLYRSRVNFLNLVNCTKIHRYIVKKCKLNFVVIHMTRSNFPTKEVCKLRCSF